jgi:cyclohexanone monooxygenase
MRSADYDVIVVGAGFAGLYGVYKFREDGLKVLAFEAAGDVGGVWYHNRYPGARCDVDSIDYSFSFSEALQREWTWSERYAAQPEILSYLQHVADRFDLRRHFRFSTKVISAHQTDGLWEVGTDQGETVTCRFLVLATGGLSEPRTPPFEGLDDFQGEWFMTSRWPKTPPDLAGKRIGLVGTGSSGLQCAPEVAKVAGHLHVFQRTPVFTIPAKNGPTDMAKFEAIRARYPDYRRETRETRIGAQLSGTGKSGREFAPDARRALYAEQWARGGGGFTSVFNDILRDQEINDEAAEFVRERIREIVKDPATAEALCPYDHPIGARRICIDTDYYETYNRPNVTLVDVRQAPITRITRDGIQTADATYPLDVIIFAIGFDALTGAPAAIDIRNAAGESLGEAWRQRPATYLGIMSAGFPNLFVVTGPMGPSILVNLPPAIEHDVDFISQAIADLDAGGYASIEATPKAQDDWVQHVAEVGSRTLFVKARSWYMGDNIEGKPRMLLAYPGGFDVFRNRVQSIVAANYEGFDRR